MKRRSKPRTLALGSYSSGTMRAEDLIPSFLSIADDLRLSRTDRQTITRITKSSQQEDYYETDESSEDLDDLFDLLANYTPDYTYFGAHPGDGADYGVWIAEDLLQDTRQGSYDGDCYRIDDPSELREVPKTFHYAIVISDHGNCTLYRRAGNRWIEVWSVV